MGFVATFISSSSLSFYWLLTRNPILEVCMFYNIDVMACVKAENTTFFFSILFLTYSLIHCSIVLILLAITTLAYIARGQSDV